MWIMLLFLTITIVRIIFCLFVFIFQASFSTLLKDGRTFFFVWILLGCVNRILKLLCAVHSGSGNWGKRNWKVNILNLFHGSAPALIAGGNQLCVLEISERMNELKGWNVAHNVQIQSAYVLDDRKKA